MPSEPKHYRLSPLARDDLEQIWLYTARTWSVTQADRYHGAMIEAIKALSRGEKLGRPANIRHGYFEYAVGMHFVFFTSSDLHLDVIRILHRRMDVEHHI